MHESLLDEDANNVFVVFIQHPHDVSYREPVIDEEIAGTLLSRWHSIASPVPVLSPLANIGPSVDTTAKASEAIRALTIRGFEGLITPAFYRKVLCSPLSGREMISGFLEGNRSCLKP